MESMERPLGARHGSLPSGQAASWMQSRGRSQPAAEQAVGLALEQPAGQASSPGK